jgi:hypothetical protein
MMDQDNNTAGDIKQLCATPAVREFVFAEMNKTGKEQKLKGFEFAKVKTNTEDVLF